MNNVSKIKNKPSLIKTKKRVQDHGEVFTPEFLIDKMLDVFPKDAWDAENNWLEPSCGNGNFIIAILRRKLGFGHSLEEALNTTFGVDILIDNIKECHTRIYSDIVLPYWEKFGKIKLAKTICIVENNIRLTRDTLTEDFNQWYHFDDLDVSIKKIERSTINSILSDIKAGVVIWKDQRSQRIADELNSLPLRKK